MDNNLNNDLLEVIAANLPAVTSDALRDRLAQADKDQERLQVLDKQLVALQGINKALEEKQAEINKTLREQSKLDELNKALDVRDRDMELRELRAEYNAERRVTETYKDILVKLVRNTTLRET
jgi:hypothetical protein